MAVDHEAIEKILGKDGKRADTSLRAHSLQRALNAEVPKTLTPHEWEQWYAEHGIPENHKVAEKIRKKPWWRFWDRR